MRGGKQIPRLSSTLSEEFRNPLIDGISYEETESIGVILDKSILATIEITFQPPNCFEEHGCHGLDNWRIEMTPCQETIPSSLKISHSVVRVQTTAAHASASMPHRSPAETRTDLPIWFVRACLLTIGRLLWPTMPADTRR